VISSYVDDPSRLLNEAVGIELREDSVLNSISEFNRYRIPRLTINREEWAQKAGEEHESMSMRWKGYS
jgi:hypothetical protein